MSLSIFNQGKQVDRCWQSKGIWGNRTCPELQVQNHCKNCPVYLNIGQQMLNREQSQAQPTSSSSINTAEILTDTQSATQAFLILPVNEELFAVPLATVRYVVAQEKLHAVPHRKRGILLGITHIHGQIIPVISVEQLVLGTTPKNDSSVKNKSRYVVIQMQGRDVAFPIYGEIFTAAIPMPSSRTTSQSRFIGAKVRHGSKLIGIMDMARLSTVIIGEIFGEGVSQ